MDRQDVPEGRRDEHDAGLFEDLADRGLADALAVLQVPRRKAQLSGGVDVASATQQQDPAGPAEKDMDVDDAGESFRRDDIPLLWIPSCHRAGTGKKVGHVCAPNQWWE